MKKAIYFGIVLLCFVTILVAFTRRDRPEPAPASTPKVRKIAYYTDPMHPSYKSDKPGTAPDCGMDLVPVYEDDAAAAKAPATDVSLDKQQLVGVRVAPVEPSPGNYSLRLFGRVMPDESRTYKVNAGIDGYIQDVMPFTTGSMVKKDQILATFSAPNAVMTLQSYLLNLGAEERFRKSAASGSPESQSFSAANANVNQRIQQLRNIGISPAQIAEIRRTQEMPETIRIVAPADGIILSRDVSPGQKFDRGAEWFRIADVSRIWVIADVPVSDVARLRPGMHARVTVPGLQREVSATVGEVLPQFDAASGTLKVRLDAENRDYFLRPGMTANVEVKIAGSRAISVPQDAIHDSGLKKIVWVERESGKFEERVVETGARFNDRVEVTKGLKGGERIVISGGFLVSSESRLHAPAH